MRKSEIKNDILQFVKETMGFMLSKEIEDSKESLLDPEHGMNSRDLLVLVIQLQSKYNIMLKEEDIIKKRLDYLNNLVDCIILADKTC